MSKGRHTGLAHSGLHAGRIGCMGQRLRVWSCWRYVRDQMCLRSDVLSCGWTSCLQAVVAHAVGVLRIQRSHLLRRRRWLCRHTTSRTTTVPSGAFPSLSLALTVMAAIVLAEFTVALHCAITPVRIWIVLAVSVTTGVLICTCCCSLLDERSPATSTLMKNTIAGTLRAILQVELFHQIVGHTLHPTIWIAFEIEEDRGEILAPSIVGGQQLLLIHRKGVQELQYLSDHRDVV
mmetsp:Transcript_12450/g.45395  ORF Transcript_12450/g.45395 Transcript_12450/m.45395 type:complete len:234 (-) Transcript_12450:1422-2123(-)